MKTRVSGAMSENPPLAARIANSGSRAPRITLTRPIEEHHSTHTELGLS